MSASDERESANTWIVVSGTAYLFLTAVWVLLTIATAPVGTFDQQIASLAKDWTLHRLSFGVASLISVPFMILLLLLALFRGADEKPGLAGVVGAFFLAPHAVFVTAAYVSQCTLFPRLLADMSIVGRGLVKLWYYNNPDSIPYMLDMAGLVFFALGGLAISWSLLADRGEAKAMGWLLFLSGLSGLIGFGGYVVENLAVESLTVASGFLTVPFCVLAILRAVRLVRTADR